MQNVCTPFPLVQENYIFHNFLFSTPNHSHTIRGTVFIIIIIDLFKVGNIQNSYKNKS